MLQQRNVLANKHMQHFLAFIQWYVTCQYLSTCNINCLLTYSFNSDIWVWNVGIRKQFHAEKKSTTVLPVCVKNRSSTPNFMTYGELGRTPIDTIIKVRMVCFWMKLLANENKLSNILYQIMFHLKDDYTFKWINYLKLILDHSRLRYVWTQQLPLDVNQLKIVLKQNFKNAYIQKRLCQIDNSSR